MLVGVMNNSTTANKQKNAQLIPSKMCVKVNFITPKIEKIEKFIEDFLFLVYFVELIKTNLLDSF